MHDSGTRAMRLKLLIRTIPFVISIVLSCIFILYSIQPYVTPSSHHSLSYSIQHCPSHAVQNPLSYIIHHINKSENENGTKKHCFCFTQTVQRHSFITFKSSIKPLLDKYVLTFPLPLDENPYLEEFYTRLSVRSPPSSLV